MNLDILNWILILLLIASNFFIWIEVKAGQKSTHRFTYVDPLKGRKPEDLDEKTIDELMEDPFDNIQ